MSACPNGVETPSRRNRAVSHRRRRRRMGLCLAHRSRVPGCSVSENGACRTTDPDGLLSGIAPAGRCRGLAGRGMAAGTVAGERDLEMAPTDQEVGVRPFCRLNNIVAAPWWWLRQGAAPVVVGGSQQQPWLRGLHQDVAELPVCFNCPGQSQFTSCSDGKANGNWAGTIEESRVVRGAPWLRGFVSRTVWCAQQTLRCSYWDCAPCCCLGPFPPEDLLVLGCRRISNPLGSVAVQKKVSSNSDAQNGRRLTVCICDATGARRRCAKMHCRNEVMQKQQKGCRGTAQNLGKTQAGLCQGGGCMPILAPHLAWIERRPATLQRCNGPVVLDC